MIRYPIFLLGFMASGKSKLGKRLANNLGLEFLDLDQSIEKEEGSSISEIFNTKGEDYFRRREARKLRQIETNQSMVIALGGGTPCFHDNIKFIQETGTSIYLKLDENRIISRLKDNRSQRPLLADLNQEDLASYVNDELLKRETYYQQADIILDKEAWDYKDLLALIA